jgi:hypothetical protein
LSKDLEKTMLEIESINIEDNADLVTEYDIKSVPTTIVIDDNEKEAKRWVGAFNVKELIGFLYGE